MLDYSVPIIMRACYQVLYREASLRPVEIHAAAQLTSSYHKRTLVVAVVAVDSRLAGQRVGVPVGNDTKTARS